MSKAIEILKKELNIQLIAFNGLKSINASDSFLYEKMVIIEDLESAIDAIKKAKSKAIKATFTYTQYKNGKTKFSKSKILKS